MSNKILNRVVSGRDNHGLVRQLLTVPAGGKIVSVESMGQTVRLRATSNTTTAETETSADTRQK